MWYVSGFITEAMKKCPGYVPADNKEHKIIDISVLNEKYPTSYLYDKSTTLLIQNFGYGMAIPRIPLSCTRMKNYNMSYNMWANEDIISDPSFTINVQETVIDHSSGKVNISSSTGPLYKSSGTDRIFLLSGGTNNTPDKPKINPSDKNLPISLTVTVNSKSDATYAIASTQTFVLDAYTFTEDSTLSMTAGRIPATNRIFTKFKK